RRFFEVLQECEALRSLFPEIDALFGVPQPPRYHPEIDTGVHVLMVLDQATRLSDDTRVRFAALVHDLGKGTTPKDEWPSHKGHESRSSVLIDALCRRYRIPNEYRDLAKLVARYHSHCHRLATLRPGTVLDTLKALDAFRKPERFQRFLLACQADAQGRKGLEDKPYPQGPRFLDVLDAASRVDAQKLVEKGLEGSQIAEAIDSLRLQAITEALREPHSHGKPV
ncbi:MAG: HD domain-containing protein, partial [Gammaproteobacteria bacterium]